MRSERIILSFIAVLIGLGVAGGAFYLYQHYFRKSSAPVQTVTIKPTATPTPDTSNDYLTIDSPTDESVVDKRSTTVVGKAPKGSTIIVSTASNDQVALASNDGTFSLATTLNDDTNMLQITAFFPDGTEKSVQRIITYSAENF